MNEPSGPTPRLVAGPASGNPAPLAIKRFNPRESKPTIVSASRVPADHDGHQTGRNLAAFNDTMDTDCERMV